MNEQAPAAWYAALTELCAGYTSEQTGDLLAGAGLRANVTPATRAAYVRDCLNPNRPSYFKTAELIVLMNATGRYQPLAFICESVGCQPPQRLPGTPAETPEQLRSRQLELQRQLGLVETRLSELGTGPAQVVMFSSAHAQ